MHCGRRDRVLCKVKSHCSLNGVNWEKNEIHLLNWVLINYASENNKKLTDFVFSPYYYRLKETGRI